jgi:signal transduction histidine kinase
VVDHAGLVVLANPAALEAFGFAELAELRGRHGHNTVHYRHPDGPPYPAVSEAPTNVVKHARADRAWVNIGVDGGRLIVEVGDDGVVGATATAAGSGLAGFADRIGALDGKLTVTSRPR